MHYTHIIDRSDLDEVLCYDPVRKVSYTRREELERRDWHRSDIVLVNGTRSGREYALYVSETGFSGDLWILDMLTDEQYAEVNEIAGRMRHNARNFAPASKYISLEAVR